MNMQTRLSPPAAGKAGQHTLSPAAPLPVTAPGSPGLVGRDPELRARQDVPCGVTGHGSARAVGGQAGPADSALPEATAGSAADAGICVLHCAGVRSSNPPGLCGLLRILRPALRNRGRTPAAGRLEAVEMLPVGTAPGRVGLLRLSFAVLGLLESMGAVRPLLVTVDDRDARDEPGGYVHSFVEAPLHLAQGRWLRRRRRYAGSRATLLQTAATYTEMGAEARTGRITEEPRASVEQPEGGAADGGRPAAAPGLLTAQELRIAELAGRGLSNREIGEQLGLSPRTVETYLYRIFPRLGVTARAQLAQVLRDHHGG
ncbi:response regulator transcription factor [Streptomyces sp. NPDC057486]|uniref:helix-turn-helix transcriptional regulator n=1 Tax=Streptomyces sp. NPDC057486 TaxID=3346145 RepID=UPI00368C0380